MHSRTVAFPGLMMLVSPWLAHLGVGGAKQAADSWRQGFVVPDRPGRSGGGSHHMRSLCVQLALKVFFLPTVVQTAVQGDQKDLDLLSLCRLQCATQRCAYNLCPDVDGLDTSIQDILASVSGTDGGGLEGWAESPAGQLA